MAGGVAARLDSDGRSERRDEVLHRARLIASRGESCSVLIVNLSPGGLMARCDRAFTADELVCVELPGMGPVPAEVRWSLGGRIGCRFVSGMPVLVYEQLLTMIEGAAR